MIAFSSSSTRFRKSNPGRGIVIKFWGKKARGVREGERLSLRLLQCNNSVGQLSNDDNRPQRSRNANCLRETESILAAAVTAATLFFLAAVG